MKREMTRCIQTVMNAYGLLKGLPIQNPLRTIANTRLKSPTLVLNELSTIFITRSKIWVQALLILHCSEYNLNEARKKVAKRTVIDERLSLEDAYVFSA